MTKYFRLKLSSTIKTQSLIEVFERGLEQQLKIQGYKYEEISIGEHDIHELIRYSTGQTDSGPEIFNKVTGDSSILSISQRLLEILPSIFVTRARLRRYNPIHIYLNTIISALIPLEICRDYLDEKDRVIVNSPFAANLISNSLGRLRCQVDVSPPVPELCNSERVSRDESAKEPNGPIVVFSRVRPDKHIHLSIQLLSHLPNDTTLSIYGIENASDSYRQYLLSLVKKTGLTDRVSLYNTVYQNTLRRKILLDSRLIINLSTSFEESMGKVILEALSWDKKVIVNDWNGFNDIVPVKYRVKTSWSEEDWFHIKLKDLIQTYRRVNRWTSFQGQVLFDKYFTTCNEYKWNLNDNPIDIIVVNKEKLLKYWLHSPRSASKYSAQIFSAMSRDAVVKAFAPNLNIETTNITKPPFSSYHPHYIAANYCADPEFLKIQLQQWIQDHQTDSPYTELAQQMLLESKEADT